MSEHTELRVDKQSAIFMVSTELLDDFADTGDLLGKALRGEIELKPLPGPKRHRCVVCWLVSKLPGHSRCDHGRMSCDDCYQED